MEHERNRALFLARYEARLKRFWSTVGIVVLLGALIGLSFLRFAL